MHMISKRPYYIFLLIILILVSPAIAESGEWKIWDDRDYPSKYYSKEIKARVVDEEGKPIEGAVVVAMWEAQPAFGSEGPGSHRILEAAEAVTDKNGRFTIPAQGPMKRPRYSVLEQRDPELAIFKKGYKALFLSNINIGYFKKEYRNGVTTFANYEELKKYRQHSPLEPPPPMSKFKTKFYNNIDEMDSAILDYLIRNETSEEAIPKGAVRESIWNGKTITLRKFEPKERVYETDIIVPGGGKKIGTEKKVETVNEQLNSMLSDVERIIYKVHDSGIDVKKIRFLIREWGKAIKDLKPPFVYREFPDFIQDLLKEEESK